MRLCMTLKKNSRNTTYEENEWIRCKGINCCECPSISVRSSIYLLYYAVHVTNKIEKNRSARRRKQKRKTSKEERKRERGKEGDRDRAVIFMISSFVVLHWRSLLNISRDGWLLRKKKKKKTVKHLNHKCLAFPKSALHLTEYQTHISLYKIICEAFDETEIRICTNTHKKCKHRNTNCRQALVHP